MKSHAGIGDWIIASYEKEVPFLQQIPRESADFFLLNSQIKEYDVTKWEPVVALPHLPSNIKPVSKVGKVKVFKSKFESNS